MIPIVQYRRPLMLVLVVLLLNAALILAFVLVPSMHFELPAAVNTNLHTLFETASIVVSILVFSAGWFTFSRGGAQQCRAALQCLPCCGHS